MSNLANGREKFVTDILSMPKKESLNDVRIILEDGKIRANKDVLAARSDYFATMFSNKEYKFIEGETNAVNMSFCKKITMEKIINYLFSEDMNFHNLSLPLLIEMMNVSSMMMLDELLFSIKELVLRLVPDSGVNCGFLPELVEGLMLAEKFQLETIKDAIVKELFLSLEDIPNIPEVVQNYEAFRSLPANLIKEILLFEDIDDEFGDDVLPTTKEKFDAFVFWYSKNKLKCSDKDRREITDSFELDDFTGEELLTDVRKSKLFSVNLIDMRIRDILIVQQKDIQFREMRIRTLQNSLEIEKKKFEDQKITITMKDLLLASRSRNIKDKEAMIKQLTEEVRSLKSKNYNSINTN